MNDEFTKAMIYNNDKAFLGNAIILGFTEGADVDMLVEDHIIDELYVSFIVTLCSDSSGLHTYDAKLTDFRRHSDVDKTYEIKCELIKLLEIVQKRENFKMKVSISAVASLFENDGSPITEKGKEANFKFLAEIKDISASGALISTRSELKLGQIIEFMFEYDDPPFAIRAEILREQVSGEGRFGYGCRFLNLNVGEESSIRRYIYGLQFSKIREV